MMTDERKRKGFLPFPLHPSPFTLHPPPFTLHPSPFTLPPSLFTLHPSPFTHSPFTRPCGLRLTKPVRGYSVMVPLWFQRKPMLTLTLKNIPKELHGMLKDSAEK